MRILVPLVITDAQLDEGLDVIEAGLAHVVEKRQAVVAQA
jgi:4-aminobutyrate aminotransferase-like enzyme